jgi:hypothetical protein
MWLWRLIQIGFGYATSYLKVERTSPKLFVGVPITRGQIGRFYWINLLLAAFAIDLLFIRAQWDQGGTLGCSVPATIPFLGLLILAELASLILLGGSALLSSILSKGKLSFLSPSDAYPSRLVLRNRLHRLFWGAFPWVLIIAAVIATPGLTKVIEWCSADVGARNGSLAFALWITLAAVWPGLIIGTVVAAGAAYGIHRFESFRIWSLIWLWAFTCYLIVIAVVGPADILHLVSQLRDLRTLIDGIVGKFVGVATN